MSLNRVIVAWVLALWSWSPGANGQEQSDATGVPGGLQFAPDSPMSFPSGATWIDESMPQGAIPGDRHISGGNVYIAVSRDGKQLFAFSSQHPKWVQPSVAPPGDPKMVLIADDNVAAAWSGAYCFAYSGLLGRWDVLELTGDEPARPRISRGAVGVDLKETDYVFRAEWGKWFSADDIKAGRVAEYLAEAPPSSPGEQIRVMELGRGDANNLGNALRELLRDKSLSIVSDPRTNSLIVRGAEADLQIVEELVRKLDADAPARAAATKGAEGAEQATRPLDLAKLREQYASDDKAAHALARKIRGAEAHLASGENGAPPPGHSRQQAAINGLRNELRDLVGKAFRARQESLAGEVADLERRTDELRQSIARREAIAEQVIDRRVEDLLDPSLKWDAKSNVEKATAEGEEQANTQNNSADTPSRAQKASWNAATVAVYPVVGSRTPLSGVVISSDGAVLTQLPDGEGTKRLIAHFDDGSELEVTPIITLESRLAILKPWKPIQIEHFVPLTLDKLEEGQTLFTVSPTRVASELVVALLARKVARFDFPLIQLQSNLDVSCAGSPILTLEGKLAGISVLINGPPGGGRVFAIPTSQLIEMFKAAGFDLANAAAATDKATPENTQ